jgi:hypothetical protein
MKQKNKKYFGTGFEIILLITATFAISYMLKESSKSDILVVEYKERKTWLLKDIIKKILEFVIDDSNLASAQSMPNLAVHTCLLSKNGSLCQAYLSDVCNERCNGTCIASTPENVPECKLGTCYDEEFGTCQARSTQKKCEDIGKIFIPNDPLGNNPACRKGCCILKNEAFFITSKECEKEAQSRGIQKIFKSEVSDSVACWALSGSDAEGACVFKEFSKNSCKFTTKENCRNMGGDFRQGYLCSNKELNTNCEQQKTIECAPEDEKKDEVYWYDSCGNRENIYDSNKDKSFNNGKVLSKEQSCSLSSGANALANQRNCGNCNHLAGSICNKKTSTEYLDEPNADVVCRNMNCKDKNGKARAHGESWCEYQGSVGVDKGISTERSSDTVGSRHFRVSCVNGEIITEPCYDYRKGICVESKTPLPQGGTFSTASCRINRAMQCYNYNDNTGSGKELDINLCAKNPDCFVKEVNVDEAFKFKYCIPKYKSGFELENVGDIEQSFCNIANQKCTVVYVKKLFRGWVCEANCNCKKAAFTEQMNDFCMSLGDCGAQVNYLGTGGSKPVQSNIFSVLYKGGSITTVATTSVFSFFTKKVISQTTASSSQEDSAAAIEFESSPAAINYKVNNAPPLSKVYLDNIARYADEKKFPGQSAEPGNIEDYYSSLALGIPQGIGTASEPIDPAVVLKSAGTIVGIGGTALGLLANSKIGVSLGLSKTVTTAGVTTTSMGAVASVFVGAAVAFALTSFLLSATGVGRGLPPELTYGLLATATIGGAIAGYAVLVKGSLGATALGPFGLVAVVVVLIIIGLLKLFGIGKIKKVEVEFTCLPWQAPPGAKEADCNKCGSDGFPCSKYACNSLGQTCEIINEDDPGTTKCINVAPDDTTPPIISPLEGSLPFGYRYEELPQGAGMRIITNESDGCFKETYAPIPYGIKLNEAAQCKVSSKPLTLFDDMEDYFGVGQNRFLTNQTAILLIPSLESFGFADFDPFARINTSIYVKCQDKSANQNQRDYIINYCVKQGPDKTSPVILDREPFLESIRFDASSINASVFVSEPADCKWDFSEKNYSAMKNKMACLNGLNDYSALRNGFQCTASFPTPKDENLFYIRCLDQPWRNETDAVEQAKRNEGNTYQLKLNKVKEPLRITSISPDNQSLVFPTEPTTIEIIVKTAGGLDGTATCFFKTADRNLHPMAETFGSTHRQILNQETQGKKDYTIFCVDQIGNTAEKNAVVIIKLDANVPKITRAYEDSGNLVVITNENAECVFGNDNSKECRFEFSNGSLMAGSERIHSLLFNKNLRYYIKCKDSFGNGNLSDSCGIIVGGIKS